MYAVPSMYDAHLPAASLCRWELSWDVMDPIAYISLHASHCRWELSWDVMEPIAYIISLFYSLVGYTYFLATRGHGVFDLAPFKEFWYTHLKVRAAAGARTARCTPGTHGRRPPSAHERHPFGSAASRRAE